MMEEKEKKINELKIELLKNTGKSKSIKKEIARLLPVKPKKAGLSEEDKTNQAKNKKK